MQRPKPRVKDDSTDCCARVFFVSGAELAPSASKWGMALHGAEVCVASCGFTTPSTTAVCILVSITGERGGGCKTVGLLTDNEPVDKHTQAMTRESTPHNVKTQTIKATDIYKRLLLENRDDLALNVYVAMCYYKLDYYDVSLEILAVYLQAFPDSAVAMNLKVTSGSWRGNGRWNNDR